MFQQRALSSTSFITTQYTSEIDCSSMDHILFQVNVSAVGGTSAEAQDFADTDVAVATNVITITSHGFTTGRKVALTNDGGALPTGLSATDYFVIKVTDNTLKLASSLANALAGTAVDITAAEGGGTHTLTPTALAGATFQLMATIDDTNWILIGSATNITAATNFFVEDTDIVYKAIKGKFTCTSGLVTADVVVAGRERLI